MDTSISATCLCGAVTLTTDFVADEFSACHCGMCVRWAGGPFFGVDCGTGLRIDGADSIAVYDSSPWADRGFCKTCGTHLFWRVKERQEYHVPLGLLGPVASRFARNLFVDRQCPAYSLTGADESLTEAQVVERYAKKAQ